MPSTSLTINGKTYEKAQLLARAEEVLNKDMYADWEKSVYNFIVDWLSSSPDITAFTSGSTGTPKPVRLNKAAMRASARATQAFFQYKRNESSLLCLSADFIAGKMMIVRAFVSGLNLVIVPPSSNPLEGLPPELKIKFAAMVPLQLHCLAERAENDKQFASKLGQIEILLTGGSPVSRKLSEFLSFAPFQAYAGYGMTETLTHIAIKQIKHSDSPSHYVTLPGVEVFSGKNDCLEISAPHLGLNKLATNDVAQIYSRTEFDILGRIDNVINTGSVKVFPEAVEQKLGVLFPDQRFILFSIPDEKFQHKIALLLENRPGMPSHHELTEQCKKLLDPFEVPKQIFYTDEFKLTSSGKIQRQLTIDSLSL